MQAARYERAQVKEADMGDFKDIESLFQEAARNDDLFTTEQAVETANSAVARNIPPYDPTANTPQKAYLLDEMITTDVWGVLASEVSKLKAAGPGSKAYPPFVLNRLKKIRIEVGLNCSQIGKLREFKLHR